MDDDELVGFIEEVTGESHLRVETDLGDGFVRLRSSEAERRQAKHDIRSTEDIVIEMLRNARDAGAHLIYMAATRDGNLRKITMIDDGDGIPEALQETIFEPRVTSKLDTFHMDKWGVHGRGMALFSIRCNARISQVVCSAPGFGTSFYVETDLKSVPERKDQSSMPQFFKNEDGSLVVRGPRNINRTIAEFALEEKEGCHVYLGSPNDIVATLVTAGSQALGIKERTFHGDVDRYPICLRPALANTPEELADIAASIGLDISERSARRILDNEIAPVASFLTLLDVGKRTGRKNTVSPRGKTASVTRDARGLSIAPEDLEEFRSRISDAFAELAHAYYLDDGVTPEIKVSKDGIRVIIPTMKER